MNNAVIMARAPSAAGATAFNRDARAFPSVLSLLVDNWPTPMVRLETECTESRGVWAKLEFYNPLSRSVKDRAAWAMLRDALESGVLKSKLEEATSGIALAALSSILGLRFTAYLPSSAPEATEAALKVFGACVVRLKHKVIDISSSGAVEGVLEVARGEGLFVGLSSGAAFKAYRKVSGNGGGVYVLAFPGGGFKYVEQIRRYLCEACAEGAELLDCKRDVGGESEWQVVLDGG